MKKILVSVALVCAAFTACTTNQASEFETTAFVQQYDNSVLETLKEIYGICLECYSEELSARFGELTEKESFEKMLEVVRYCDMLDTSGDFMPELDGYDEIAELLWPNGYGNNY